MVKCTNLIRSSEIHLLYSRGPMWSITKGRQTHQSDPGSSPIVNGVVRIRQCHPASRCWKAKQSNIPSSRLPTLFRHPFRVKHNRKLWHINGFSRKSKAQPAPRKNLHQELMATNHRLQRQWVLRNLLHRQPSMKYMLLFEFFLSTRRDTHVKKTRALCRTTQPLKSRAPNTAMGWTECQNCSWWCVMFSSSCAGGMNNIYAVVVYGRLWMEVTCSDHPFVDDWVQSPSVQWSIWAGWRSPSAKTTALSGVSSTSSWSTQSALNPNSGLTVSFKALRCRRAMILTAFTCSALIVRSFAARLEHATCALLVFRDCSMQMSHDTPDLDIWN